jgi:flagella basal body P-ring formation protein FlgA
MILPDGALGIKWWPNPQYRWVGPAVFRGEVTIDGETLRTVHLKAMVEAYADVLVAATDIARGKTLSSGDVMLEKRGLSSVRGDAVQSLEEAVGLVTRSTILAGQIITSRGLLPRQLIKRNQMVNVETRVGGLVVRGRARSLANAVEGDVITCVNLESKEEFQGVVRDDSVVVVE